MTLTKEQAACILLGFKTGGIKNTFEVGGVEFTISRDPDGVGNGYLEITCMESTEIEIKDVRIIEHEKERPFLEILAFDFALCFLIVETEAEP